MVRRSADKKPQSQPASNVWKNAKLDHAHALNSAHAMIREPAGTIKFWASGLERLYGFPSAEAVGRISHELLKTEFPQPLANIDAELLDTGEWNGELVHRKRNGETIVVASHWELWRDGGKGTLVTEVNNETIDSAQIYLASIVDSSDDAIIGKTLNGIITSWNKAAEETFGYSADEICGKSVTMLFPRERVDEEAKIIERIKRGERVDHFETVRRRKDGSDVIVSLTISPILESARPNYRCLKDRA
jgi:PAS domain S-box-containing protein